MLGYLYKSELMLILDVEIKRGLMEIQADGLQV